MAGKTEEPTQKRLRRAREQGDTGASPFASQAVGFVVAVALVPSMVRALAEHTNEGLKGAIHRAAEGHPSLSFDGGGLALEIVRFVAPILAAAGITGAVVYAVQTGGAFAPKRLLPDFARLNVGQGLRRLVSGPRLFAVARALLGAIAVGWLVYAGLRDHTTDLARLCARLGYVPAVVGEVAHAVARDAALFGLALGAADLWGMHRAWRNRLRMSKGEVRREAKEGEGDPNLKAARERAYGDVLAQVAVANVRHATVVVVNPTHLACALRYDEEDGDTAPVVLARGDGEVAARMIEAARVYGVPVVRDVPLARALVELHVGDTIPEALFEAVAEILREAWRGEGA